ncbi:hypothetical protein Tco_0490453 [Tanacetum coccineum]
MADKEAKSTTRKIIANDQADYYSGITSITVNGKNTYELKGKFLNDLHKNAFSCTNREYTVEHIEYFLKIVDPIDLPNVNRDKLRIIVFPISLVGDSRSWFDRIKGSITSWVDLIAKFFEKYYLASRTDKVNTPIIKWDPTNPKLENMLASNFVNYKTMDIFTKGALWDYWKLGSDKIKPTNDETSNLAETNLDDEQDIGDESSNNGWRRWDGYEIANHDHEEREYEYEHEDEESCEVFDDHELPVCTIRRLEMIKYSFGQDKETSLKDKKLTMLVENLRSGNLEVLES